MANNCLTDVSYRGDKRDVKRLVEDVNRFMSSWDFKDRRYSACIFLIEQGIDESKYNLRSRFDYFPEEWDDDEEVSFSFEDDWGPQDAMVLIASLYDLKYTFYAEEGSDGVYVTNNVEEYGDIFLESRDYSGSLSEEEYLKLGVSPMMRSIALEDRIGHFDKIRDDLIKHPEYGIPVFDTIKELIHYLGNIKFTDESGDEDSLFSVSEITYYEHLTKPEEAARVKTNAVADVF